jgi:hypothetical protein
VEAPPRGRGRERLALAGAFLFLAAALGTMWAQLRAEEEAADERAISAAPAETAQLVDAEAPASMDAAPLLIAPPLDAPPSAGASARHGRKPPPTTTAPRKASAPAPKD